jgi:N-acetylglutamate synthase-like GNAT family acetyltransferase
MVQPAATLNFKKCNILDADMLHCIYLESYKEHYTHIWDDKGESYLQKFYQLSKFQDALRKPHNHFYSIHEGIEPMGFLKLTEKGLAGFDSEQCLEINKIYLLKSATGKGIGSKVLGYIDNLAMSLTRPILWVNVMQESRARSFYEQHGFELISQVTLNYPHLIPGLNVLSTYKKELTKF